MPTIDPKKIEEWKGQRATMTREELHALSTVLLAEREEVLAVLRAVEWGGALDGGLMGQCPVCLGRKPSPGVEGCGHAPGEWWGRVLDCVEAGRDLRLLEQARLDLLKSWASE